MSAESELVSVEFELTPEEWVEVHLQHSSRSPLVRESVRNVRVLLAVLVVLAALLSWLSGSGTAAVTWLLAGGALVALLRPLLRASHRRQFQRFAAMGTANGVFGPHRLELRSDGMLDSTAGYEWLTRWPAIERVEESPGAFLVYTGPNAFLPIPHSAFRDSTTLRRFSDTFYALREAGRRASLPGGEESTDDG